MIHLKVTDVYSPLPIGIWTIQSFKAGFLNAAGFFLFGKLVSHLTGIGTQFGISVMEQNFLLSLELIAIPVAFIIGASIAVTILDFSFEKSKIPPYPIVQILVTILIGCLLYFGTSERGSLNNPLMMASLLSVVCGIENAFTTWASHGKMRSTHITGLITDIGMGIPTILFRSPLKRFAESRSAMGVRVLTLISFIVGATFAAFLVPKFQFYSFALPYAISVVLCIFSIIDYISSANSLRQETFSH